MKIKRVEHIAFLDPASTGNILIELAELPATHGHPA